MSDFEHKKPNGEWDDCNDEWGKCKYKQREKIVGNKKSKLLQLHLEEETQEEPWEIINKEFNRSNKIMSMAKENVDKLNYDKRVDELYEDLDSADYWVIGTFKPGDRMSNADVEERLFMEEARLKNNSTIEANYYTNKYPELPNRLFGESEDNYNKRINKEDKNKKLTFIDKIKNIFK